MKRMQAVWLGLATLLVASVCAVSAPRAQAQGNFGGGQIPPQMMARIKEWQKWREANKNLSNLGMMVMQVRETDKDPATRLTKPQATKILNIIRPWRNKPTMTNDQAREVSKQIGAVLTVKQLKKMSTIQPPWARRGGGGGGGGFGGGRPGGGPGGGGPRPGGFTFPEPPKHGYNPLNPDTMPFPQMRAQARKSMDEFLADLARR
ncbi:MAG TPA: hypothetical protein VFB38_00590 [Chthonomonadaceae bacterium]|nr:hypothetical protein [Chthonomonadaceae bacterium]